MFRDMAIFVLTTMTTQPITLPLAHARMVIIVLLTIKPCYNCIVTIVGNMIDCKGKPRKVTEKQGSEKAQLLGIEYIEASSLENINIDKVNSSCLS